MYLSITVCNEITIVPWTIIQQEEDVSFSALFHHIKSGAVSTITPSTYLTRSSLVKVSVGQSRDVLNVVEMGHSVNGVCSVFGCFIKFEVQMIISNSEVWITEQSLEEDARRLS
uniref:Uncharacterized protein n=1 Tax=Amphimedon queenslandica TaxID=400682 RepID=A0A1X7TET7_AMPQE